MRISKPTGVFALVGLLLLSACGPAATPTLAPAVGTVEPTQPATAPPTLAPSPPPTEPAALPSPVTPGEGAGNADVLHVRAVEGAGGDWTFHVTVQHPDTGWDDYADGWDVVTPDGTVLQPDPDSPFTRLLLHPHAVSFYMILI